MGTDFKQQPIYQQIAHKFEQQIRSGQIKAGQKLDSIRSLAAQEKVSINTIRLSLDVLQEMALIKSQPRVGFVVAGLPEKPSYQPFEPFEADTSLPDPSRQWLQMAMTSNDGRSPFVNMVLAYDNDMFKSFQRCFRQVLLSAPKRGIEMSLGHLPLREALCQQLSLRGLNISASDLQITDGCQHAIEHALRVTTQAGDTVAIPTPAFPGYLALASLLRLRILEIPMTPDGPEPGVLKQMMHAKKIKALIINPICHNPTGSSMDDDYKQAIASWAKAQHIAVIEDDICAMLCFNEQQPRPIASFDTEGWVLLVSSISKHIGDSERIGWCYPGRFKEAYFSQCAISQIAGSYYRQTALARYLTGTRYKPQLRQWRQQTQQALMEAIDIINDYSAGQVVITPPSGAYSLWLRLPEPIDAEHLRPMALQQGVNFLPGHYFSLEARFKNFIRLVIIPPLTTQTRRQLKTLARLIAVQAQ